MPSISSTPKALPLGKMIVFITIRVGDAICPRASHFSPSEGTHENPALATCVGGTSWVTLGEQTRVICRECRSFFSIQLFQSGPKFPVALNNFASEILLPFNNEIARCFE